MKSKTVVTFLGGIAVLVSVLSMALSFSTGGIDVLLTQGVSLAITILLVWFLIRGSKIAKWIAVVLFGISGLLVTMMGTSAFSGNPNGIIQLVMGLGYLAVSVGLLVPPASRHFRKLDP